jgi:hypothetical protein
MEETKVAKIETFHRELSVLLTDDEKRQRGMELARAENELTEFNDRERKARLAELKAKESDIRARIAKLAGVVTTGSELRRVECRGDADYANGRVLLYRVDTGELIGDRALKDEERQVKVPGTEAIRATECGHLTAKEDGVIPKLCKTCQPDDEIRRPLKVVDVAGGEKDPDAEPTDEQRAELTGDTSEPIPEGSLETEEQPS